MEDKKSIEERLRENEEWQRNNNMNTQTKPKSIEERLDSLEKWQRDNIREIRADFMELKHDYMKAPGVFDPNFNHERYIDMPNEVHTVDDYRLDMGGEKFNREILEEDYINELVKDSLRVEQTPEITRLESEKEAVRSLKDMAHLIKACEKYVKNNPRTIQSFIDGLKMLKMQYEEGISHLNQIRRLPAGDFLSIESERLWNIKKFKESIKKADQLAYDLIYDFEDITSDFLGL